MFRALRWAVVLGLVLGVSVGLRAFVEARADPIVRRATIAMADWPAGAAAIRVVLMSDPHVGGLGDPPERLARVVAQVNALKPDLVLIAGDFLPGHKQIPQARAAQWLAPLAGLKAPLGVVAVMGNHDHWVGERTVPVILTGMGVTVLSNQAMARGPLAIGGVDDAVTGHEDPGATYDQVRALKGARLIVTHSPQIVWRMPADMPLLLAGHTHCGQVMLPLIGSLDPLSHYGRYECGLVREPGRVTVVTAGIGTSGGPFRLGAPPDVWVLTLGPVAKR